VARAEKSLAGANASSGCAMLADKSQNKNNYASMWDFRRQGWTFPLRRPRQRLFKTTDGGDHWTELTAPTVKGCRKSHTKNCCGRSALQTERGLRHD